MAEEQISRWPPPVIESYTLEKFDQSTEMDDDSPQPLAIVKLSGRNFFIRAIAPTIMIGDLKIIDYEIMNNEKMIILYLFQRPPDGSKITVSYGPEMTAEAEAPFFWDQGE